MSKSNVDLCEPTAAPDLSGIEAKAKARARQRQLSTLQENHQDGSYTLNCECGLSFNNVLTPTKPSFECPNCLKSFRFLQFFGIGFAESAVSTSPAQPRNTAPQSVAGSDGSVLTEQAPRPSLPGDDPSAAPIIHYSCGCNRVRRFAASADTCTACHKPLSIRYDNNRPVDPNIHVGIIGKMIADQLLRLRAIIDESRPHLSLADVSSALRTIDEARGLIRLHDLGETPLVMRGNYGERPSTLSSLKSPLSPPEGT